MAEPEQFEKEMYAKLGEICAKWNHAEGIMAAILQTLVEGDEKTQIITAHMSNVEVQEAVTTIANEFLQGHQKDHVLHAVKFYSRIREYRNWYVHSITHIGLDDSNHPVAIGQTYTARTMLVLHQPVVRIADLSALIGRLWELIKYLSNVEADLCGIDKLFPTNQPLSSREKPPLPDTLQKPRLFLLDAMRAGSGKLNRWDKWIFRATAA